MIVSNWYISIIHGNLCNQKPRKRICPYFDPVTPLICDNQNKNKESPQPFFTCLQVALKIFLRTLNICLIFITWPCANWRQKTWESGTQNPRIRTQAPIIPSLESQDLGSKTKEPKPRTQDPKPQESSFWIHVFIIFSNFLTSAFHIV